MKISEIRTTLKNSIKGDVSWDKDILRYYSVDSSFYQVIPKIIVIPSSEIDIICTIKIAKKFKISITVRGAGTGLVGSALNNGIVLDLKNFDEIKVYKNHVKIGPGVKKGNIDQILKREKKFSAPNPSIGPYCAMGGIIGNNASGSKALKYGSTIDNLIEVTFINGKGEKITLPKNKQWGKKILKIAKKIDGKKFPQVSKNSSGYRLDSVKSLKDTHKILAGSEGTLGVITSAKMKIHNLPKKRLLFVFGYSSLQNAALDCGNLLKIMPSSLEFIDRPTLKNIKFKFKHNTQCLLFVEFDSDLIAKQNFLLKLCSGKLERKITNEPEIEKWWKYRDSSLSYSLKSIKIQDRVPHVIEDAVVSVEDLGKLFDLIEKINKKFRTKTIMYGHAGNGNIHVRIISKRTKMKILDQISKNYFDKIIQMKGSITGEHGDGIARSNYIKNQYGSTNFQAFKDLKKLFDPDNILNPGKITSFNKKLNQYESI